MNIGITGCFGRMGSMLVRELRGGDHAGAHVGTVLSGGTALPTEIKPVDFFVTVDAAELFSKSDAVIDFTVPAATRKHAELAAAQKKVLIIGTTGLSAEDQKIIDSAAQKTAIVQAANFSVGVNVLLALTGRAAATLGAADWDIEIFEAHHHHKVDSPSGTALALGQSARAGRKAKNWEGGDFVTDREGKRKQGDIGYAVSRGGDVVGEHTVTFYGAGERVSLGHVATDRALFARGAIAAALWAKGKPPGLYSMRDVLGL